MNAVFPSRTNTAVMLTAKLFSFSGTEVLLATVARALSVQDLQSVLQSIDVRFVPHNELCQKVARSLFVMEEDRKWDHVKVLERFQAENNLLAS